MTLAPTSLRPQGSEGVLHLRRVGCGRLLDPWGLSCELASRQRLEGSVTHGSNGLRAASAAEAAGEVGGAFAHGGAHAVIMVVFVVVVFFEVAVVVGGLGVAVLRQATSPVADHQHGLAVHAAGPEVLRMAITWADSADAQANVFGLSSWGFHRVDEQSGGATGGTVAGQPHHSMPSGLVRSMRPESPATSMVAVPVASAGRLSRMSPIPGRPVSSPAIR